MVTNLDLNKLAGYIKDIQFCMLSTVNADGTIISRPMVNQHIDDKTFDGTLWFFTRKDTAKVHSIVKDSHVNLCYSNPNKQYISISGRAFLTEDKALMKKQWGPAFRVWFSEGIDDPDISLIGVNIESAEVWDTPPGKIIQVARMIKSMVTGKPYDQSVHSQHLDVNPPH